MRGKYFSFDPLMESVARFLGFQECGRAATLCKAYFAKLWCYVLRATRRSFKQILFKPIMMDWLTKYSHELKYVKILVIDKHATFFSLSIPSLHSLHLVHCSALIRLPTQLRALAIRGIQTFLPAEANMQSLVWGRFQHLTHFHMSTIPKELKMLGLSTLIFITKRLPTLPNLHSLRVENCKKFHHLIELQTKCPALQVLFLNQCQLKGVAGLRVPKLVVSSESLTSVAELADIHVDILDLQKCPNVEDFSAVQHLKCVIKPTS
jgi:hypothetical protein